MIKNYLLIAFRVLKKERLFTVINLLGLAVGQCAAILIILFVLDEYNTNNWIRNIDRQYMLESSWKNDMNRPEMTTLAPLGKALKQNYPNLVANYFSIDALSCNISDGVSESFRMNMQLGNSSMLPMFGIPLISGDANSALIDKSDIVIQKEVALKFFGSADVLGRSLFLETQNAVYHPGGKKEFTIAGVIDELPINSLTDNLGGRADIYINSDNIQYFRPDDMFSQWDNYIIQTRIELQPGVNPEDLKEPIDQLISKNATSKMADEIIPKLTPLKTYNLTDNNNAKQRLIYILVFIALFILIMAIINFVNISLGMARKRLREIGVRKAMGVLKWQLRAQFLTESLMLSLTSLSITLCLVQLSLPTFLNIVGKSSFTNASYTEVLVCIGLIALIIGVVSGIYPALVLSNHTPVTALKGKFVSKSNKIDVKNVMLTIQYVLTLFVVVSSVIVSKQTDYITTKEKGYDSNNVLVASSVPRWYSPEGVERMLQLTKSFESIPGVSSATLSYEIPDGRHGTNITITESQSGHKHYFGEITSDEKYLETYGLEIVEGRFFNDSDRERSRIVLNESAAKTLFKDKSPIGELVLVNDSIYKEVIGVTKDFHFSSVRKPMEGIVFSLTDSTKVFRYMSFKLDGTINNKQVLSSINDRWNEAFPLVPFEFFFMEDKLTQLYKSDNSFRIALITASIFALSIVLIGVFSLTVQNLSYRIKEIGIRRVLGATVISLLKMLMKEQVWYFLVAVIIATPITYIVSDKWLGEFSYRIEHPFLAYFLSFITIFLLALVVMSSELWKTIRANPVDSLRHD